MMETPVVVIDCQRAGPSTGVPTKTEQGDLWQMLGAAFGDYPRAIAAPLDIGDCFKIIPEIFNIADRYQCPGIVLCDLLLSEGRLSVDPKDLDFAPVVDRGELITEAPSTAGTNGDGVYKRYKITESGISPRAVPGVPGYTHTAASDEHDEDGVLISDEFTNPTKRRAMMEKRMRKVAGIEAAVPLPEMHGPRDAEVTLIGWGSTKGVIEEACEILNEQGISANQVQIRWLVPLHGDAILDILKGTRHTIIVENNYSGQFARYLRSETSFVPNGYIRKYDGEPFMSNAEVSLNSIRDARNRTAGSVYFSPCPLSPSVSEMSGQPVYLKLENLQRTGSFKERGALNKILTLNAHDKERGVIAASAGNHAQGVAFHAQANRIAAKIVMPVMTPLVKVNATKGYGAHVVLHASFCVGSAPSAARRSRS